MIFHVLGPLQARGPGGAVVELGGRKSGAVLAMLLLHPNAWVGVDRLMAATWHEQAAPASAEANLKTYVCRLRRVLPGGGSRIESRSGAYRVRVAPGELDADRVAELASAARDALARGDQAAADTLIEDALALWRGRPFEGLTVDEAFAEADRLDGLRRDLREGLAESRLARGRHHDAIATLRALTTEDPLRESAWALLVRALHAAGRRGEALTAYLRARSILAEELGVEPGPALAAAHRKALTAGAAAVHPRRELPRDVAGFVGRDAELAALRSRPGHAPVVVDGMTGVGKTAFAVHAAHRLAPEFPDGQFFVDLRAGALDAGDALARLLRGLGVDAVPADLDERAALWRSELARRRVLLVLDDAADDGQVRPLLPGTSASLTLITTRHRGWRLQGERRVELAPLGDADSALLFRRASGGRAVPPDAVVRACGGLPEALLAAAGRLQTRPLWTEEDLLGWIAEEPGRLLSATGIATSWRGLTPAGRAAFHALGTLPAEFDCRLAAQHTGTRPGEARRLLEELVDAHLLDAQAIGRYRSHPLVRAHAGRPAPSSARVA